MNIFYLGNMMQLYLITLNLLCRYLRKEIKMGRNNNKKNNNNMKKKEIKLI